jgi:hypothetical protein
MGLDSYIDAIMRDNPQLSREDAEQRFLRVLEDEIKFSRQSLFAPIEKETSEDPEEENDEDSEKEELENDEE